PGLVRGVAGRGEGAPVVLLADLAVRVLHRGLGLVEARGRVLLGAGLAGLLDLLLRRGQLLVRRLFARREQERGGDGERPAHPNAADATRGSRGLSTRPGRPRRARLPRLAEPRRGMRPRPGAPGRRGAGPGPPR